MAKRKQTSNYDYFVRTDTSAYAGEWIAIADKKIVSHGKNAQKVFKAATKKAKGAEVSLAKVPHKQMLVLTFSS